MTPTLQTSADSEDTDITADEWADPAATGFNAFYPVERPRLVTRLMEKGFSFHVADDAAQCAMIELYPRWEIVEYPRSWLQTVAFRYAMKMQQPGEILREDFHPYEKLFEPAEVEDCLQEYRMLSAIKKLPPTAQQVLLMYYDGLTTSQIAKKLKMKEETVRKNRSRALDRLKGLLAPPATQDDPGWGEEGASK